MVSNEAKYMLNKLAETVSGKEVPWKEAAVFADASTDHGKGAEAICKASGAAKAEGISAVPMKNNRVLDAVKSGKVKMLYLMGEDPLAPEKRVDGTLEALKQVDFLVVQDIALNETAELADVVLRTEPSPIWKAVYSGYVRLFRHREAHLPTARSWACFYSAWVLIRDSNLRRMYSGHCAVRCRPIRI